MGTRGWYQWEGGIGGESYSATKGRNSVICGKIELEDIVLCEIRDTERQTLHVLSHVEA
jgi:hypothetical protein